MRRWWWVVPTALVVLAVMQGSDHGVLFALGALSFWIVLAGAVYGLARKIRGSTRRERAR